LNLRLPSPELSKHVEMARDWRFQFVTQTSAGKHFPSKRTDSFFHCPTA
jgi:hypothetical protein